MLSKEELQKLFGPKVIGITERRDHIGMAPCLILEKGTSPEEKREICEKFKEWKHLIFLESIGCKDDNEYNDFIYGKGKFRKKL